MNEKHIVWWENQPEKNLTTASGSVDVAKFGNCHGTVIERPNIPKTKNKISALSFLTFSCQDSGKII